MYIAIDVGGTTIRVVGFNDAFPQANGRPPLERERREFRLTNVFDTDIQNIFEAIDAIIAGTQLRDDDMRHGIGLAVAGRLDAVDMSGSRVLTSGNLRGWHDIDLRLPFFVRYNVFARILNDAQAAGLGEATYGKDMYEDFWFVIWGTGIGGSLVIRTSMPYRFESRSCEPGHQTVDPRVLALAQTTTTCSCGQQECLEAHAGGAGIEKKYGKPAAELDAFEWDEVTDAIAGGIRNLVTIQPTEMVVFGGGIAHKRPELVELVETKVRDQLHIVRMPDFAHSQLGDAAGIYGALAAARL